MKTIIRQMLAYI